MQYLCGLRLTASISPMHGPLCQPCMALASALGPHCQACMALYASYASGPCGCACDPRTRSDLHMARHLPHMPCALEQHASTCTGYPSWHDAMPTDVTFDVCAARRRRSGSSTTFQFEMCMDGPASCNSNTNAGACNAHRGCHWG